MTPEQKQRCQDWYQRFIDYRGYEWETGGACINERKHIKLLVTKYSDVQLVTLHDYLFNRHFKWSKPDFRYKIGAYEVYTEAPSVIQVLKAERSGGSSVNGHTRPKDTPAIPPGAMDFREVARRQREAWENRPDKTGPSAEERLKAAMALPTLTNTKDTKGRK